MHVYVHASADKMGGRAGQNESRVYKKVVLGLRKQ